MTSDRALQIAIDALDVVEVSDAGHPLADLVESSNQLERLRGQLKASNDEIARALAQSTRFDRPDMKGYSAW